MVKKLEKIKLSFMMKIESMRIKNNIRPIVK